MNKGDTQSSNTELRPAEKKRNWIAAAGARSAHGGFLGIHMCATVVKSREYKQFSIVFARITYVLYGKDIYFQALHIFKIERIVNRMSNNHYHDHKCEVLLYLLR